ncbi:Pentatricopeptide repeat-containing protein [Artemisia annua]|uniref:Pentatricopeptide repeat-containing protein n=1 Tax=Artemisia annua TaxID=35608 RepID=A0A2U1Q7Q1_ARTAN|nr:Pentatricopeptide repeat-containing protein [Artemisia annua]
MKPCPKPLLQVDYGVLQWTETEISVMNSGSHSEITGRRWSCARLVTISTRGVIFNVDPVRPGHIRTFPAKTRSYPDISGQDPVRPGHIRTFPVKTRLEPVISGKVPVRPGHIRTFPAKTRSYPDISGQDPVISGKDPVRPGHIRTFPAKTRSYPDISGQDPVRPGHIRIFPAKTRLFPFKTRLYPVIHGQDPYSASNDSTYQQVVVHSLNSQGPQVPKAISGKCKIVTEKILSLKVDDDPTPLIAEWIHLLQPTRVDWIRINEKNDRLHFKIAELLLDEESFQSNIRDYSKLVDAHAELNQLKDAERIIIKMNKKGIEPDILTKTIMVHMYSKSGNLTLAKEAFESLRSVNAGDHKSSDSLMRDLESKNLKHLSLLRSYAQTADPLGAGRISNRMELAGYHPSLESCTYLVEAYSRKGNPDQARSHFDELSNLDINLMTSVLPVLQLMPIRIYRIKGCIFCYSLKKMELSSVATYLLKKVFHLQALGVLEANRDKLKPEEFEKVISAPMAGGFRKDAERQPKGLQIQIS